MSEPAAYETVVAAKQVIAGVGGAFMISRYAKAAAVDLGLPGGRLTPYFAGRCGFLGDVDADVVTAAVAFFPPSVVRRAWQESRSLRSGPDPQRGGLRYAAACHEWGRVRLSGWSGAERLAELGHRIVAEADVAGLPLFASWRVVPLPDDAPARAAQMLHVLREHRGGAHAIAVVASGLTPLESILAGPGGTANAEFFEWTGPFPDLSGSTDLSDRRAACEQLTDRLVAPAYSTLDATERDELVTLLSEAAATAFAPR